MMNLIDYVEHPYFAVTYAIILFESVVMAVKTTRCHWKLWYVPKFTAASHGTPCDSTASC